MPPAAAKHDANVLAWVVMPEHVHLILFAEPAGRDIVPAFLKTLKQPFARHVLGRWRNLNASILSALVDNASTTRFWQPGGGFDRNVIGDELVEKVRYIHRNPITRGLAETSVDWPWSSARAYEDRADAIGPRIALHRVPAHLGTLT